MRSIKLLAYVMIAQIIFTSCGMMTSIKFTNNTGQDAEIQSGDVGNEIIRLKNGKKGILYHHEGPIYITLTNGIKWYYTKISVPENNKIASIYRFRSTSRCELNATINTNGDIQLIKKGLLKNTIERIIKPSK